MVFINKKKLFSRGIIPIYKDHGTTIADILRWIRLTLYFEDPKKEIKSGMLYLECMPRYADLIQTGLCAVGFGLHGNQIRAVGRHASYQWTVTAVLGRQTVDHYVDSPLIKQHEYRHVTSEMVRDGLSKYIGRIEQNNPCNLYSEWVAFQKMKQEANQNDEDNIVNLENIDYSLETYNRSTPIVRFCDRIELIEMDDALIRLQIISDGLFNCRSLIRDLGQQLGCYASIDRLHLNSIGPLSAEMGLKKHEIHYEQVVDSIEKHTEKCGKYLDELIKLNPESSAGRRFI